MFSGQDITIRPSWLSFLAAAAMVITVSLLASCGGEDAPETIAGPVDEDPLVVSSGAFDMTAEKLFDTCNSQTAYAGRYDVVIDEAVFTMGDAWVGNWDQDAVSGYGESEREQRVIRFCTITTWTEVNVQFTSEDTFTGEIVYRRRVSNGSCSTPCTTTWRIRGTRTTP